MKALLIRHAATTGQDADAPLTPEGDAHATRLATWLAGQNAGPLYSSPYLRARQTLEPYVQMSARRCASLESLRERLLSPTPREDWQDQLKHSFEDHDHACPGGESMNDVRARVGNALVQIIQLGGALPSFVTHGGVTSALFSAVDPSFGFEASRTLRNPDVFQVTIAEGQLTAFQRIEWENQT